MKKIWLHRVIVSTLLLSLHGSIHAQTYTIRMDKDTLVDLSIDNRKISKDSLYVYDKKVHEMLARAKADKISVDTERMKEAQFRQADATLHEQEAKLHEEEMRLKDLAMQDQERELRDQEMMLRQDEKKLREDQQKMREDEAKMRDAAKKAAEDHAQLKAVIEDLIDQKIIPDEESLVTLELNENGLVVNGKKQPESVFAFFRDKYVKGHGLRISLNRHKDEISH